MSFGLFRIIIRLSFFLSLEHANYNFFTELLVNKIQYEIKFYVCMKNSPYF